MKLVRRKSGPSDNPTKGCRFFFYLENIQKEKNRLVSIRQLTEETGGFLKKELE